MATPRRHLTVRVSEAAYSRIDALAAQYKVTRTEVVRAMLEAGEAGAPKRLATRKANQEREGQAP